MARYCDGDEQSFNLLFERYAGKLHGFLLRQCRSHALADDLLQLTWLNVHRARATFATGEKFRPWIYTVANNIRRDEGRRGMRDRSDLTRTGGLPDRAAVAEEQSEEAALLKEALAEISETHREVIVLHRWQDLSFAEIAQVIGTTEGAVKLRAHRGYLALRDVLLAKKGNSDARP